MLNYAQRALGFHCVPCMLWGNMWTGSETSGAYLSECNPTFTYWEITNFTDEETSVTWRQRSSLLPEHKRHMAFLVQSSLHCTKPPCLRPQGPFLFLVGCH